MKGSDYAILGMTFAVGLFAGVYFYVTAFAPEQEAQRQARAELDWEVVGRTIGGCEMSDECPQLYIASNREYRYSATGAVLEEGQISRALAADLTNALRNYDRDRFNAPSDVCQAALEGTDYEYDLDVYSEQYALTTCGSSFVESNLAAVLEEVWQAVAEGGVTNETPGGLQDWLERELDRQFDYDDQ